MTPRKSPARSRASQASSATESPAAERQQDPHEQIQADVQTLLTEMSSSFKSFSETIFTKSKPYPEELPPPQHKCVLTAPSTPFPP